MSQRMSEALGVGSCALILVHTATAWQCPHTIQTCLHALPQQPCHRQGRALQLLGKEWPTAYAPPSIRYITKRTKKRWLQWPMQLLTHGQWWSIRSTHLPAHPCLRRTILKSAEHGACAAQNVAHRLQMLQWCAKGGLARLQCLQYRMPTPAARWNPCTTRTSNVKRQCMLIM